MEPGRPRKRRRASMREVADRAGVAMSSVSRTLSGHPDVSEEMRQRVLEAVDELGYKPDLLAQGLRSRASLSIGFVAGDISNPLIAQFVSGTEVALREAGYSMLLTNSLVNPELDQRNIELLEQRRVDGMIAIPVVEDNAATSEALAELEIPLVLVERELTHNVSASRVYSDHRTGMVAAARHLFDLGHRRIALIGGQDVLPTRMRREAVESVYAERGEDRSQLAVREGVFSIEHGAAAAREMLAVSRPPTAMIAGSNQLMIGALQVVTDLGLELGRDLSFVGCDDVEIAKLYRPHISVVDRERTAIGRTAAELLLAHVRNAAAPPEDVVLPTRYLPRASCGPVR
jgi:LacI family transcriptional regulator